MRNIKLTLEYDGAPFNGFQIQPDKPTVQRELEIALSKIFDQRIKIIAASGRTDAGVHAWGQVVNFKIDNDRPLHKIQHGLNSRLHPAISVKQIKEVKSDFHARYHAKSKVYLYRIWNAPWRSPLYRRESWHIPAKLDLKKMSDAVKYVLGKHNFKAFSSSGGTQKNYVRTLKKFEVKKGGYKIDFEVEADGFLYHMVRNLVGTVVECGEGSRDPKSLKALLKTQDRKQAGRTAPALGLALKNVKY